MKRKNNILITPRAAIYARVSSQKQKEGDTIESQVKALRELAIQKDYQIPDSLIFLDDGVSGSILHRPALDELRDVIRTEPINVVFIYSPDRLSRSYAYQLILLEDFSKYGVKVCFLKSPPEADTPEAKMLAHVQGIFAEYERAMILDRSRRGRIHKAKQDDPSILPCMPYGYQRTKKDGSTVVCIVEEKAVIVKEIFRLFVEDRSPMEKIAKKFTEAGIMSPKNNSRWNVGTIRGILKNQAYIGVTHYGKSERCEGLSNMIRHHSSGKFLKSKNARRIKPEEEWIPISMPQIINENDFELAQEQLKKNVLHASRNTKEPGLLQGLVICGECGEPFYKRSRKKEAKKNNIYYCRTRRKHSERKCTSNSINQELLDQSIYNEVLKLLQRPDLIKEELRRRSEEVSGSNEVEQKEILIKKELFKISQERDRLLDAYQEGVMNLEELGKRNGCMNTRKNDLERSLQSIKALKFQCIENGNLEQNFDAILKRMELTADSLSFQEKQKIVRLLVDKVIIYKDQVTLVHCISPRQLSCENGQLISDGPGYPL